MSKKTALYDRHISLGAKMVEFAGFIMPIQYSSITEEHLAVRNDAGLFDVSHMGEFKIIGEKALDFINYLTINDCSKLQVGQVQYSAMCYPDGGLVDDLLVYRFPTYFMLVVNAANLQKDFQHIQHYARIDVHIEDESDNTALLALQGPKSTAILQKLTDTKLDQIKYYWFASGKVAGLPAVISRTGYTGEIGYEIYLAPAYAPQVWDALIETGKPYGLKPVGLGARDSLRLEMKYCLYGNDIDKSTNPLEAGLGWITKLNKSDFLGKDALQIIKAQGMQRKLIGFEVEGKAFPRQHYSVFIGDNKAGEVTSGTFSPVLKKGIGLAYIPSKYANIGQELSVLIRDKKIPGKVVETPFVKK